MIKKLDRYLFGKFISTFVFMVLILVVVVVVIDVAERLDDFIKNEVPLSEAITRYYLNFIPWLANLLSPICVFLAAIFFTARLTQNSEIIAMLSGGVSFYRILMPYMAAAVLFSGLSFWLNAYLVPESVYRRTDFEYEYFERKSDAEVYAIHKKVAPNIFAYLQRYDGKKKRGNLFELETFDSTGRLTCKLTAPVAIYNDSLRNWRLEHPRYRWFPADGSEHIQDKAVLDTVLPLRHEDVFQRKQFAEGLPLGELKAFIDLERERGSDILDALMLEYYQRFALPFASIVMTIIAFALSTKKRRGGIALQLGLGFIICFAYVFLLAISSRAFSDFLPTWLAVWLPNFLFFGFGLFLLRLAPK